MGDTLAFYACILIPAGVLSRHGLHLPKFGAQKSSLQIAGSLLSLNLD